MPKLAAAVYAPRNGAYGFFIWKTTVRASAAVTLATYARSWDANGELTPAFLGSTSRPYVNTTSSAVSGAPSDHVAARSLKAMVRPSL